MTQLNLIATATFGLEAVVARELNALGYETQILQNGRIGFAAPPIAICRSNLFLRVADRVLINVGTFEAKDFGELFDQTVDLPWENWITKDAAFPVKGRSVQSQLASVPACQKIVKKAIVERLKKAHGGEWLDETGPTYTVEVGLLKDKATLTIDTTGAGLHKRGYRALQGFAPLKETLAAALVLLSFWRNDRPLLDPFCGTGTIPIEAAMIGRNIAPGLNRIFAAQAWPNLSDDLWQTAREEALDLMLPDMPARIIGTDIDGSVLSQARYHAQQADVEADIHWQQRSFEDIEAKHDYGCLITNPPYGQRMGEHDEIQELYKSFPQILRGLETWSYYIFTAHPHFESLIGQQANRRRKLYNGRIECTYFQFHGPRPPAKGESRHHDDIPPQSAAPPREDSAPAPAFGGLPDSALEQVEMFKNRLAKQARHLRRWPTKRGITCYRLYDRDIPEIPLVVDRYEDCLHLSEHDRPNEHTAAQHSDWLDLMIQTAAQTLEIDPAKVYWKKRGRQRGTSQYERVEGDHHRLVVNEGGLKFLVNLSDYVDTGLFLDHRITRGMVRDEAQGKRFLNLFAYTGAFSVYAAAGGAASTTSVDLSNTYTQWAQDNIKLNGFDTNDHQAVRSDVMAFLQDHTPGPNYDLMVIDPPTFSNSKSTDDIFEVQRDHVEMLDLALQQLTPGGTLYFSNNFRRFKLDEEALAHVMPGLTIREISSQTVPDDFRNKRIHRCWRVIRP